tara:strand:+ start:184 stop:570 length:387 start_codon:yes stop_codon:yes gene_type:complete
MINPERRVYVYFNLHKNVFSVRQAGVPVQHFRELCLKDVRYLVGKAGRERVLREKVKNVHAGCSGYLVSSVPIPSRSVDVTYNPYKYDSFVCKDSQDKIETSDYAYLWLNKGKGKIEAIYVEKSQVRG